jgi:hypothetical protein
MIFELEGLPSSPKITHLGYFLPFLPRIALQHLFTPKH